MKTHRLGLGLLVLVAFALVGVVAVRAQGGGDLQPIPVIPEVCRVAQYDLNGDSRLDVNDFNLWRTIVTRTPGGACQLGASATLCPPGFDATGDGYVTYDDLNKMIGHYRGCLRRPTVQQP